MMINTFTNIRKQLSMADKARGNTFSTFDAELQQVQEQEFEPFFRWLYGKVAELKKDRDNYYKNLRDANAWWINLSRRMLSLLGAAALLLTALAGAAVLVKMEIPWLAGWETAGLFGAFIIYAIMGAIALYERGTDLSSAYFRHLAIGIAIRNLWNDFQLTVLKEYPTLLTGDKIVARERAVEMARTFCKEMDGLVTTEQTAWRTEFTESLKELDTIAKDGLGKMRTDLEAALMKAATAADEAQAAADQAKAALLSGDLNLTVTGDFDGNLLVLIDKLKRHDQPVMKKFSIRGIAPGTREIEVRGKKGPTVIAFSQVIEIRPGVQTYTITLP